MGSTTRAGRIRVLEDLIGDLEGSIRPVLQRLQALRGVVEQERDALFMEERRALRARERTQTSGLGDAAAPAPPPALTMADGPGEPDRRTWAEPPPPLAGGASAGTRTQYSASSDGKSAP